ncbi:MAG: hypothetical protein K2F71_00375 [Paramuribaculum sp.]|nr:hypothetical protein [Paramuribaculum sp.]
MKKEITTRTIIAPQPVLVVATYDADSTPDAMNVAWGGQCWDNEVALRAGSTINVNCRAVNRRVIFFML